MISSPKTSGWLRQARHRAAKHGVSHDLVLADLKALDQDGPCDYCGGEAAHWDNPVPLSEGAPAVPANLARACSACKAKKRDHSVAWLWEQGLLSEARYLALVAELRTRRGWEPVRVALRRLVGLE